MRPLNHPQQLLDLALELWEFAWTRREGEGSSEEEGNERKYRSTMIFCFLAEGQTRSSQNNHQKAAKVGVVRSCGHSWNLSQDTMLAQGFIVS